jgi:eukaryotic-like serine/threonine-protein kinase
MIARIFRLVLVLLVLGMVSLVSALTTMHFAIHGAEVAVPDLRGLSVGDAVHKTASMGMNISVDNRFYSSEVPVGRVLTQSPLPGTVVRREWHVRVSESLGPQRVTIPNLIGQQERVATIQLRRLGLEVGAIARMPDATAPEGTVIAQNPPPEAAGVERPSVSILVALTPPPAEPGLVMPDLVGQNYTAAALAVTRAGLKMAPLIELPAVIPPVGDTASAQLPRLPVTVGMVIAQSPPAGHRVVGSTPIQLTTAR